MTSTTYITLIIILAMVGVSLTIVVGAHMEQPPGEIIADWLVRLG